MRIKTTKICKGILALLLVLVISLNSNIVVFGAQSSNSPIRVTVDGTLIHFDGTQPIMVNSRVLVPVRGVFEALGYDVEWFAPQRVARLERRVTHYTEIHSINIPVDGTTFTSHHWGDAPQVITPDVPQQLINGRTMLPLRAISEAMVGVDVRWDGSNRTVIITTGVGGNAGNATPTTTPSPMPTATPIAMSSATPAPTATPTPVSTPTPITTPSPTPLTREITPMVFDEVRLFNNNELQNMVAVAPLAANTRSAITLPNRRLTPVELDNWIAEYVALGGINAFELEIVRLMNLERANNGLAPLHICPDLMMAARFMSHESIDLNHKTHGSPVYDSIPALFGRGNAAGNMFNMYDFPHTSNPVFTVNGWMDSPGHRQNILSSALVVGVGVVVNDAGGAVVYAMFGW